jgi:hypothetical protein
VAIKGKAELSRALRAQQASGRARVQATRRRPAVTNAPTPMASAMLAKANQKVAE